MFWREVVEEPGKVRLCDDGRPLNLLTSSGTRIPAPNTPEALASATKMHYTIFPNEEVRLNGCPFLKSLFDPSGPYRRLAVRKVRKEDFAADLLAMK